MIREDDGLIGLSPSTRTAWASGQGTHAYFLDPRSGDPPVIAVLGSDSKDNVWVNAHWNYYADGFSADFTEEGNLFAGVFATADVTHSKIGETDRTSYVYDGVAAHSKLTFEFSVCPNNPQASEHDTIPLNITFTIKTEVSASDREDVGRVWAYIKYEERTPRRTLKYVEVETKTVDASPQVFVPSVDELPRQTGIVADDEQIVVEFFEIEVNPWKVYVIELYCGASAYSTLKAEESGSDAMGTIFIDPSFRFSSEFEDADDYSVFIHSDMLDSSEQSSMPIGIEQDGTEVSTIDKDGGPVTFTAPSPQPNMNVSYLWSAMNPKIKDLDDDVFDEYFTIDPSMIPKGTYTLKLITFPPQEQSRGSITFEIVSPQIEQETENQGNGIPGFPIQSIFFGAAIAIIILHRLRNNYSRA